MQDAMMEMRDLRVSILRANASWLCFSRSVKILIQIQKIIYYNSNLLNNKTNHSKIYDFSKNILNKTNGQTLHKKSVMLTIRTGGSSKR
jgi:hypothetical protein